MKIDWRIIKRWALGIASEEEMKEVRDWEEGHPEKQTFLRHVIHYYEQDKWMNELSQQDILRAWKKLDPVRLKRKIWMRRIGAIAASVVIGIGIFIYGGTKRFKAETILEQTNAAAAICLILSDGSKYELNKEMQADTVINGFKINSSGIQQVEPSAQEQSSQAYHEIIVPRCGEYHLTLADGTCVYLNAESSLRFPEKFGQERKVYLSGEAYFDVVRDTARPFYVEFEQTKIEVLGTQFNVKAYPGRDSYTTLVAGSVSIEYQQQKMYLKPGQQCEINCQTQEMLLNKSDMMSVLAWKNGEFIFRDVALGMLMDELSRWYDVAIEYEAEELKELHFSLYVERSETLKEVLQKIALTDWIEYQVDEKKIVIRKR